MITLEHLHVQHSSSITWCSYRISHIHIYGVIPPRTSYWCSAVTTNCDTSPHPHTDLTICNTGYTTANTFRSATTLFRNGHSTHLQRFPPALYIQTLQTGYTKVRAEITFGKNPNPDDSIHFLYIPLEQYPHYGRQCFLTEIELH
jgi:hypothetical protein